jgi:hypothetical protein
MTTWDEAAEELAGTLRDAIDALEDGGVSADDDTPEARLLVGLRHAIEQWDASAPHCPDGHRMTLRSRFRLDHEPGDSPRDTELLARFEAGGLELGADAVLWYCARCNYAHVDFAYPDDEAKP